jgi:hypothetical protein
MFEKRCDPKQFFFSLWIRMHREKDRSFFFILSVQKCKNFRYFFACMFKQLGSEVAR